jgi:hypothetical protein
VNGKSCDIDVTIIADGRFSRMDTNVSNKFVLTKEYKILTAVLLLTHDILKVGRSNR